MNLKIDRIEIESTGANPIKLAQSITSQIVDLKPPIPVKEIAYAIDILEIRVENLKGLEGALVCDEGKLEGKIVVRADQTSGRTRFTIAHELGHYVNPTHDSNCEEGGFRCKKTDMLVRDVTSNNRYLKMEAEANQFAAELLMPKSLLKQSMKSMQFNSLEHIYQISNEYDVSLEAASRQYLANQIEIGAIVFSKDGIIRYVVTGEEFPRLSVWNNSEIPDESISADKTDSIGTISAIESVPSDIWLERFSDSLQIREQTVEQKNGYRMTMLTVDYEKEDESEEWDSPRFR